LSVSFNQAIRATTFYIAIFASVVTCKRKGSTAARTLKSVVQGFLFTSEAEKLHSMNLFMYMANHYQLKVSYNRWALHLAYSLFLLPGRMKSTDMKSMNMKTWVSDSFQKLNDPKKYSYDDQVIMKAEAK
jgi:hypothetical protein